MVLKVLLECESHQWKEIGDILGSDRYILQTLISRQQPQNVDLAILTVVLCVYRVTQTFVYSLYPFLFMSTCLQSNIMVSGVFDI